MDTKVKTVWELLENPPANCEGVAELVNWSMNFDYKSRPYLIFLDLIGYSEEEYGSKLVDPANWNLGYYELHYLGEALKEYAQNPQAVDDYIAALNKAEDQEN